MVLVIAESPCICEEKKKKKKEVYHLSIHLIIPAQDFITGLKVIGPLQNPGHKTFMKK